MICATSMILSERYTPRAMSPDGTSVSASSMLLLPRLTKQVIRRSGPDLLGMDLRLLMALSYLGDHDGAPQQELVETLCMDANNVVLLLNELEERGRSSVAETPMTAGATVSTSRPPAARRSSERHARSRRLRTRSSRPSPTSATRSGTC